MFARFDILDFIDLGGDLNIKVTLDTSDDDEDDDEEVRVQENNGLVQEVYICVSKDRQPKLVKTGVKSFKAIVTTIIYNTPKLPLVAIDHYHTFQL